MRISSSDSRSPTSVIGGAWSQSPACGVAAALNLAVSVWVFESSVKIFSKTFAAIGVSQAVWICLTASTGFALCA